MLSVNNVTVAFGGEDLFSNFNFLIKPGDRIGLAGRNGAGKSTLLKVLAGDTNPASGTIALPKGFKIGLLRQDIHQKKGITVWEETETALAEIKSLHKKSDDINHQLATRTDYESDSYMKLIEDLNTVNERLTVLGGFSYEGEVEKILLGLGFTQEDFAKPIEKLSGGWQMRVELAKLLLQKNDLLLLDEPTNHLDIESIMWLEEFLVNSPSALVLVSHDRVFLNCVTNRTIEISLGRMYDYPCTYDKYLVLREEQRTQQIQAAKNQEKEIKQTEQLIERFRAKASKASFAQSLIKKLEKMDRIEVDVEDNRQMNFRFPPAPRSGKVVYLLENIKKTFGPKVVLRGIDLEIERGQRVAFVGKNGMGKSTLVKIMMNELEHEGTVEIGHNVKVGYFAQNQAEIMDGSKTVLRTIEDAAPEEVRPAARNILGSFMFSGEDVDKKVKVLSGGERGRLALCKLMLQPHNVLILDEPTNHLDMRAKDVLKQALLGFDGTLIVVSHDRDFLNGLCNKVVEFKDGLTKTYLGGIEYFLEEKKLHDMRAFEAEKQEKAKAAKVAKEDPRQTNKEKAAEEREFKKKQNRVKELEAEITSMEESLALLDAELQNPDTFENFEDNTELYHRYEEQQKQLNALMEEWEKLNVELGAE